MRKKIILFLKARLKADVPEVQFLSIWNEQLSKLPGGATFPTPAVFIQFDRFHVRALGNGSREADVPVLLHIVTRATNFNGLDDKRLTQALDDFDLIDKIVNAVVKCGGDGISKPMLTEVDTDHEHNELCEDIETFTIRTIDTSAVKLKTAVLSASVVKQ